MFNLDKYEGLAKTTIAVTPATQQAAIDEISENVGSASVTRNDSNIAGLWGAFQMSAPSPGTEANLIMPTTFGRQQRSMIAYYSTVSGLARDQSPINAFRHQAQYAQEPVNDRQVGVIWRNDRVNAEWNNPGEPVQVETLMSGGTSVVRGGSAGYLVDMVDRRAQFIFGGAITYSNNIPVSGTFDPVLRLSHATGGTTIGFDSWTFTIIHGYAGPEIVKVL